jgi:phosphoribosyl 1,2-cyclic phosphodiesterase
VEIRLFPSNRLIIIDAGTGLRPLGEALMIHTPGDEPIRAELFLSHTHWDHIVGFPFFTPLYRPGTALTVYGPVTFEDETLEHIVGDQLRYRYFPMRPCELAAQIDYHQIGEEVLDLGQGLVLRTKYLNHSLLSLGYRFEYEGRSVCTAFDTEPFRNVFPTDPADPLYDPSVAEEGRRTAREANAKLVEFYHGADLLIHDAQYTREEYLNSKMGWGHTAMEDALNQALAAGVGQLALFHHDPNRSDGHLGELEKHLSDSLPIHCPLSVFAAREQMVVDL